MVIVAGCCSFAVCYYRLPDCIKALPNTTENWPFLFLQDFQSQRIILCAFKRPHQLLCDPGTFSWYDVPLADRRGGYSSLSTC